MFQWSTFFVLTKIASLAHSSTVGAEVAIAPLGSIGPLAVATAARARPAASAFITPSGASVLDAAQPADNSLFGQIATWLNRIRPPPSSNDPREAAARFAPRDAARERDATSLGIPANRAVKVSSAGAAMGGIGVGAGGAQLLDLASSKKLPVRIGPTVWQGGGGLSLKARW